MILHSEAEMLEFGEQLGKNFSTPTLIELIGDVGAGKTTITRGIATGMGVSAKVTSPSFTISKSYAATNGRFLTHYDFYRLSDPGLMAEDLAESINDQNTVTVIEWANSVADFLPPHTIFEITLNDDGSRTIEERKS